MREYSTPINVELSDDGSLTDDLVNHVQEHPDLPLFSRRDQDDTNKWIDVTANDFHQEVRAVAAGLVAAGVEPGDRVVLLSRTRYEWTLIDYANWYIGAVTVPVYETTNNEQISWIVNDSEPRIVIVESAAQLIHVDSLRPQTPQLEQIWALDDGAISTLTDLGKGTTEEILDSRRAAITPQDIATIIYTSGTTGPPKGCVLTHGNFMFELGTAVDGLHELFDENDASTLLFLPLAHVFARIIQVGCVKAGVRMGHSADMKNLINDLGGFRPTFILAVPRVFEKLFNTSSQLAVADGKGKTFDKAAKAAIAYSQALERGKPGPLLAMQHQLFDRLVYQKLRAALGGNCKFALSGGAPLGELLCHFYRGMGIPILEGYGLTETTAALTVNLPDEHRVGTVGRPLQGTAVRVADDGELWFKGGQVFTGYWRNEKDTDEVLEGDWLKTGDLGEIDEEGFVRITGRKKEIIVTAGGKNVAPGILENRIKAHPLIDQALVVGEQRPFIGALITLDRDQVTEWARQKGKSTHLRDLVNDEEVIAEIDQAVSDANQAVSRAESIRKYEILREEWTEEGGQLTPSLKLKRNAVLRQYSDTIESLYTR